MSTTLSTELTHKNRVPQYTLEHYERDFADRHLLHGCIEKWAREKPDFTAIIDAETGRQFSYRQFDETATALALKLLEMGFTNKADKEEGHGSRRHRKLYLDSRFDDVEPTIIELAADGRSYSETSRVQIIARVLPEEPPGLTAEEILANWPKGCHRPYSTAKTLWAALNSGEDAKLWSHTGGGRKGDPCRYYRVRI